MALGRDEEDLRDRRPALRRDHHRDGCRGWHTRPPAGPDGQAGAAARTRRLRAPRARQLELHCRVRQGKYRAPEFWYDADDDEFPPEVNYYYVGGNTKFYGAALFRLRLQDFGELRHHGGISPAWPLRYEDFEPYETLDTSFFRSIGAVNPSLTAIANALRVGDQLIERLG